MKLVICDDDVTLRSVVSRLAEGLGHIVIAETDSAADAVELVTRFGAEGLVLDLSLPWGTGMAALHDLRARGSACQVIVFTSYLEAFDDARESGARAVIEKPDFEALESVLGELAGRPGLADPDAPAVERRRPPRERPKVRPPAQRSPSGLDDPDSFADVLAVLEPGDGILYVHLAEPEGFGVDRWSVLLHTDRRLAVARTLGAVLRLQDRVSAEDDDLVAVLLDAGRVGVESAWRRLERAHERSGIGGVVSGGWGVVEEHEPPFAAHGRARAAVARSIGQPPGDRLWAG